MDISSKLCGLLRNSESEYMNFTMHHQFYYFIGLGVHCTLPLWSFLGLFIGLLEVTSDLSFHKSKTNLNQSKMTLKLTWLARDHWTILLRSCFTTYLLPFMEAYLLPLFSRVNFLVCTYVYGVVYSNLHKVEALLRFTFFMLTYFNLRETWNNLDRYYKITMAPCVLNLFLQFRMKILISPSLF